MEHHDKAVMIAMTKTITEEKGIAVKERSSYQILEDDEMVAGLYLKGHSLLSVVAEFKKHSGRPYCLTVADVAMTMDRVRKRWQKETVKKYDDWVNIQLAKLDKIEVELWGEWEKSKLLGPGNPKYMEGIRQGIQQRLQLMRPVLSAMEGQAGMTMAEMLVLAGQTMKAMEGPRPLVLDQTLECDE